MSNPRWTDNTASPPVARDVSKAYPLPVQVIGGGAGGGGATTGDGASDTGTLTSVATSTTAAILLAANTARYGATITNDSAAILYVGLSNTTPTSALFTVPVAAGGYYEVPFGYIGIIRGILASGTGNARVTELT